MSILDGRRVGKTSFLHARITARLRRWLTALVDAFLLFVFGLLAGNELERLASFLLLTIFSL